MEPSVAYKRLQKTFIRGLLAGDKIACTLRGTEILILEKDGVGQSWKIPKDAISPSASNSF